MQKKQYNKEIGKSVQAMAAAGMTQKKIGELLPDVAICDMDRKNGLYRQDWESGLSLSSRPIIKSYLKMAASGKCWPATKYWLTTKGGIVEPKEPETETKEMPNIHLTIDPAFLAFKAKQKEDESS